MKPLREFTADLFVSVDGFASGVNEAAFFGYFGEELGRWIDEQFHRPQILVMGRVTFSALAGMAAAATDPVSVRMTRLPKLVFSATLPEPPAWANTRIVRSPAVAELKALKEQPGEPLRSVGSLSLVRSLIRAGLVDRLRLMIFPVVLGNAGREPVFAGYDRLGLQLAASTVLDSRLILLEFQPERPRLA